MLILITVVCRAAESNILTFEIGAQRAFASASLAAPLNARRQTLRYTVQFGAAMNVITRERLRLEKNISAIDFHRCSV